MAVCRAVFLLAFATVCACCSALAEAPAARSLFDPARHMRVSEVRPGMKGHGLSVFSGTRIERFEVEVISILKNFNPKYDVILVRCAGANLEHTGAVGGMSGSPVYLCDDDGRERLVGAFAYGWPLLKDPLAGVQPIEYMLQIPEPNSAVATTQPADGAAATVPETPAVRTQRKISWDIGEVIPLPGMRSAPAAYPLARLDSLELNPKFLAAAMPGKIQPLATPLMASGVSGGTLDRLAPLLQAYGMTTFQAGAGGGSNGDRPPAEIEPGSVLAAPLLSGDVELTAVGTTTEVIGDRVFGFGHPFNNEGPVSLPMGSGEINAVLPSLAQSSKIGALTKLRGALVADQSVGVVGKLGASPETGSIELRVLYTDGSQDVTYRFNCAIHPRLTPPLAGLALASAMTGRRELPQHHTLDYDLMLEFANGAVIDLHDRTVNSVSEGWAEQTVLLPALAAANNPFERITLRKFTGTIRVTPESRDAEILSVNLPRMKYKPGDSVKAFVTYRPFRAAEAILPIDLELPRDLPDGKYRLVIGDRTRHLTDERTARPFRFTAESVDDVFTILRDLTSMRNNSIYVRLLRQADGVAVGRVALSRMPSSRRQVMLGSGRSNTTAFVSSTVKIIPTELVMKGAAEFTIEINSEGRVETGGSAGTPRSKPSEHQPPGASPAKPAARTDAPKDADDKSGDVPEEK
jgi:hypothetical protein